MNQEINNGAVRILRDYTGRGPTKARSMIDDDSVTILLGDTLTPGERRLAESGKAEHVINNRHEFQRLMRDDLVKVVEDALDRKVIAFMSANHIDPDMAVEVFVLERRRNSDWTPGNGLGQLPSRRDWSADIDTCGRDRPQSLSGSQKVVGIESHQPL